MQILKLFFSFSCLALFTASCCQRSTSYDDVVVHGKKVIPPPMRHELIIVDAGHGGKDAGTSSKLHHYEEKQQTLDLAQAVVDHLKKMGYKTLLTRKDDTFVPLETRAEIANAAKADLFVSVHYNFSATPTVEGVEVYTYKELVATPSKRILESKELAQKVLKSIISKTGAQSRGLKQANFAVVRQTQMPAILIEAGFLSNPAERAKILDPAYRDALAKSIAEGVDAYFK